MKRTGFVALVLLYLGLFLEAGCTVSGVIMMQDPKTGQVFRCERSTVSPLWDLRGNEDCAQGLERAGWKRL